MKINIRFKVDQGTNYGDVMAGEEKLIPEEAADLFVKRGIAEYVLKETEPEPCDPVFDKETTEALVEEIPEEVYTKKVVAPIDTEATFGELRSENGDRREPPATEIKPKSKKKKRAKRKPFSRYTNEN